MKKITLLFILCFILPLQAQIAPSLLNQFDLNDEFYPQSIAYYNGEIYMPDLFNNRIIKTSATTTNAPIVTVVSNVFFPTGVQLINDELYFLQAFSSASPTGNTGKLSKINLAQNNPSVVDVFTGLNFPLCLTGNANSLFITELNFESETANISQIELASSPIKNILFQNRGYILDMKLDNANLYWTEEFDDAEKLVKYEISDTMPIEEEIFTFDFDDYPERILIHNNLLYFTSYIYNESSDLTLIKAIDLSENQLAAFDVSTPFFFNSDEVYLAGMVINNNDLFVSAEAYNMNTDEEIGLLYTLDVSTLSVQTVQNRSTIQFYPNPASTHIQFSHTLDNLQILDLQGKLVSSFNTLLSTYDVSSLTSGIYILKGKTTDGQLFHQKLIKK